MKDGSHFISEESDNNIFNRSDNVAVANSDVGIIDGNKLKTEVMVLKVIVSGQLCITKLLYVIAVLKITFTSTHLTTKKII